MKKTNGHSRTNPHNRNITGTWAKARFGGEGLAWLGLLGQAAEETGPRRGAGALTMGFSPSVRRPRQATGPDLAGREAHRGAGSGACPRWRATGQRGRADGSSRRSMQRCSRFLKKTEAAVRGRGQARCRGRSRPAGREELRRDGCGSGRWQEAGGEAAAEGDRGGMDPGT